MRGAKSLSNTHHGFNVFNNEIIDIRFIKFPEIFEELIDNEFYYCGVHIPNDFITKQIAIKGKRQQWPLLYDFYLSQ